MTCQKFKTLPISYDGVGPLTVIKGTVNGEKYRKILQDHFLPYVADRNHRGIPTILQDDNAPVHRAKIVQSWKQQNHVESLEWPAQSPDINPIENVWMELKKAIGNRNPPPRTVSELEAAIEEEWQCMPVNVVKKLIESMPRRLSAVIRAKGFATKY